MSDRDYSYKPEKCGKLMILPGVLCVILFISIFDMPYGFYTFARISITIFSLLSLLLYSSYFYMYSTSFKAIISKPTSIIVYLLSILIIILWNPLIPIYLDKETWIVLDVFAIIAEVTIGLISYIKSAA